MVHYFSNASVHPCMSTHKGVLGETSDLCIPHVLNS